MVEADLFRDRLTTTMDNRATSDLLHHLGGAVFEVTSRPQYLDSQIIGRVFGFQDITQRIQAETSLREPRDQLEERVRVRTFDLNAANKTLTDGLESTLRVVWNEVKYKADVVKEYAGIPPIACFASQLNQVFMNLLVNAAQAIKGHGTITLRTGHDEQELWVEVADTGEGIQPEHLARIFEPFFTTKPVGQWSGLGLSLGWSSSKQPARAHRAPQ